MKVSHLVSYYPNSLDEWFPLFGGVDIYVYNLTQTLSKLGIDIIIHTSRYPNYYPKRAKKGNIEIKRYLPIVFFLGFPIIPSLALNLIRNNNGEIIHGHVNSPLIVDSGIIGKKIGRKPFIVTYQADPFVSDLSTKFSFLGNIVYKPYLRILYNTLKNADKIVVATSIYAKNSVILSKFKEKIVIIPNGINTDHFKPKKAKESIRKILGIEDGTKVVTFVGRLVRYKGVEYLIKAVPSILNKIKDCQILVVGDGPLRSALEDQAKKLGISKRLKFLGTVSNSLLVQIYSISDLLVLPSTSSSEGFGLVLAEAMSCEVPVIASNVGGIPNVVKSHKTGLIIKPRNTLEIVNATLHLLENEKLRKRMGKMARKHVIQNFSIDQVARKTLSLYQQVLRK